MPSKVLVLTPRSSDPLAEAMLLWRTRKLVRRKGALINKFVRLSETARLAPNLPADNAERACPLVSKEGNLWRGEPTFDFKLLLKRIVDVLLSSIALLFLWPLLLVIAIAVKLESAGPVIYPSQRAGKDGHKFDCYKFRTMIDGSDRLQENLRQLNQRVGPFFKIADDPRVTGLGRFLRKYSLDELPQFWNVLKGDMSLVGPRPHPVEECSRYSPEDCQRLEVKPGITGLWQVLARANPSFETCLMLDVAYIEKWSLLLDLRILLKTIPAVMAGEGQ